MPQENLISKGKPAPLGTEFRSKGINFALFSVHATSVTLCLFSPDGKTETDRIKLPHKTGDIWHGFINGLKPGQLYGYRVDGPYEPSQGHRFNANKLLIDPYAKTLFGDFIQHDALYGYDVNDANKDLSFSRLDSAPYMPKSVAGTVDYKWGKDNAPHTDWSDTILYEAHVKGLTRRHNDIAPAARGTLSGLSDPGIIDHLKYLGVTALELLPLQSFFTEPRLTEMGLTNYWGYNPVNYFSPHNAYLGPKGQSAVRDAVKALHKAGIEVILDVVYNHTAESWELGPTLSYRGIDNVSYYHLADDPRFYVNHTGCGNTLKMSDPRVLDLTLDSLRYWVEHIHIDGFRFDLAPTLARNPQDFDPEAPFFKAIKSDPILSKVKLIAEPWDIGPGGYVLGQFPKDWTEWNDRYRDDVRSFWRGDAGAHQNLASALLGSARDFDRDERKPKSSVNFIAAHDGFTLNDTVSFNQKHNLANGEDNRDGHGHNISDNMGVEGETNDPNIIAARRQRKKNMLATLILSQGTPMLLAGDEFGQSQNGNNNAYCQDNETVWLNWEKRDSELERFTRELITLRKRYPHFSQSRFLHGEPIDDAYVHNVEWLSPTGYGLETHDWENPHLACFCLALSLSGADTIILVINRGQTCEFKLPHSKLDPLLSTSTAPYSEGIVPAHSISIFKNDGYYRLPERRLQALSDLARQYGIVENYRDITGHVHQTSGATKEALLAALGVSLDGPQYSETVMDIQPSEAKVFGADLLREQGGCWGVTAGLYGLRSDRNWGIGDFEDLAVLAEIMAGKGADFIGVNPVHALFPSAPHLYAPYSPSSRQFLNVMLIAPDKIPDLPKSYRPDTQVQNGSADINYDTAYKSKMSAFETAFAAFSNLKITSKRQKDFKKFVSQNGQALQHHALFDALFETLPKPKRTYEGWKNFPKKFANPDSKARLEFAANHSDRIEFYAYLQWIAETQLVEAQSRAKTAGMTIGIYLDFAVGIVPGGAGTWHKKKAFATNVSLGAPGDMANPDGQNWNLSPFNPFELARNNFEPYRGALRKAMSLGGAIRIDHILGHFRSFWTPKSGSGGYVRYPFDGLMQMIADESQKHDCVVFGEDLGTVPDDFRDRMSNYDLMGCNIALIERDSHSHIIPRENLRELSITGFSNHDFPTLTGFWNGEDFKWRETLGIGNDSEMLAREKQRREKDKSTLLGHIGLDCAELMTPELMSGLQAYLAGSPALAFAVQLDDLMLEPMQANVPGTTDEQPNWRRRARLSLEEVATNTDVTAICNAINKVRKGL